MVKRITSKPVVGVGRFTSPDAMVGQVRRGVLDLHRRGAALDRRSVPAAQDRRRAAGRDPRMHRLQHLLRHNYRGVALRCTQNPTMGEE